MRVRTAVLSLALASLAAGSVAAQVAGPVRPSAAGLQAARFSIPADARAVADPSAPRVAMDPSKPRVYQSAPLAALLGVGGMILGYGSGLGLFGCQDEAPACRTGPDDFEYTLAYTGLVIGAAQGAHIGGTTRDGRGSFWATLGGAAAGALPLLLAPKDDDQVGAYVGSMVGATAGAVAVDYLVRRPRR